MKVRRISWLITLGLTGMVIAGIAAPQALFATVALIDALPRWLIGPPAHATVLLLTARRLLSRGLLSPLSPD